MTLGRGHLFRFSIEKLRSEFVRHIHNLKMTPIDAGGAALVEWLSSWLEQGVLV